MMRYAMKKAILKNLVSNMAGILLGIVGGIALAEFLKLLQHKNRKLYKFLN